MKCLLVTLVLSNLWVCFLVLTQMPLLWRIILYDVVLYDVFYLSFYCHHCSVVLCFRPDMFFMLIISYESIHSNCYPISLFIGLRTSVFIPPSNYLFVNYENSLKWKKGTCVFGAESFSSSSLLWITIPLCSSFLSFETAWPREVIIGNYVVLFSLQFLFLIFNIANCLYKCYTLKLLYRRDMQYFNILHGFSFIRKAFLSFIYWVIKKCNAISTIKNDFFVVFHKTVSQSRSFSSFLYIEQRHDFMSGALPSFHVKYSHLFHGVYFHFSFHEICSHLSSYYFSISFHITYSFFLHQQIDILHSLSLSCHRHNSHCVGTGYQPRWEDQKRSEASVHAEGCEVSSDSN